jgi:hypothetical protein
MRLLLILAAGSAWILQAESQPAPATAEYLYKNDFEQAELGKKPKEFLILDGKFVVAESEGGKVLELPGEPLESFGFLFGPSELDGMAVGARIWSESTKRTYPAFGVGLNGVSGFRLIVSPAKRVLELMRGNEVKASTEYKWRSGTWTQFKIQLRKAAEDKWIAEGKAWVSGETEPPEWMVTSEETKKPPMGKPTAWGTPYSGKKILFDDLVVERAR